MVQAQVLALSWPAAQAGFDLPFHLALGRGCVTWRNDNVSVMYLSRLVELAGKAHADVFAADSRATGYTHV
jgi:hypothetical protein